MHGEFGGERLHPLHEHSVVKVDEIPSILVLERRPRARQTSGGGGTAVWMGMGQGAVGTDGT